MHAQSAQGMVKSALGASLWALRTVSAPSIACHERRHVCSEIGLSAASGSRVLAGGNLCDRDMFEDLIEGGTMARSCLSQSSCQYSGWHAGICTCNGHVDADARPTWCRCAEPNYSHRVLTERKILRVQPMCRQAARRCKVV